jgi:hypothetical protein
MYDEFVSIKQLAVDLGMDRSHARRYVLRLGIEPKKRRTTDSGGQLTLTVTSEEAAYIKKQRDEQGFLGSTKPVEKEVGVFYVIQIVPELDPRRIKLGFAEDVIQRLAQHRTSAPTAIVLKSWPCKRSWEGTIIDALAAIDGKLILNEVFEFSDVGKMIFHADALFKLLPPPSLKVGISDNSPHMRRRSE